jgi:cyclic lactone autoinducer peptide
MRNFIAKYSGLIAALGLAITAANVSARCAFIMHQPKLPEGAEKLRRL